MARNSTPSVGPQRHNGTDPAGAAGRQPGCEEGRDQDQRHAGERQRVERVDLEQQPAQQAGRNDGERQPERAAEDHQLEAAGDEQPHDAFAALDAETGEPLWHVQVNQDWKASPMTYMVGGRQYVAIASRLGFWAFALPEVTPAASVRVVA